MFHGLPIREVIVWLRGEDSAFRLSLDSSIFISQLTGDVHAEAVLTALLVLETMGAELTLPLLCYAELWTGVELLPEADRPAAGGGDLGADVAGQRGLAGGG